MTNSQQIDQWSDMIAHWPDNEKMNISVKVMKSIFSELQALKRQNTQLNNHVDYLMKYARKDEKF